MKLAIYLILLSLIFSCTNGNKVTSVKYRRLVMEKSSKGNTTYSMKIPKGYKLVTLVGGHNELEKQYVYSDSIKLYISDFRSGMLNYSNILSLGDSIANKRFESTELKESVASELGQKYLPETITLKGQMAMGYWKDIRIGHLCIGYVNVPENKVGEFDNILSSFIQNIQ